MCALVTGVQTCALPISRLISGDFPTSRGSYGALTCHSRARPTEDTPRPNIATRWRLGADLLHRREDRIALHQAVTGGRGDAVSPAHPRNGGSAGVRRTG